MTTPEQIDRWCTLQSEHQQLEFKAAQHQFDNDKLYRYCVALANEGGGQLVLGVTDKPPRKVVGTAAFRNPVEMTSKLFDKLGFRVDIEDVTHPTGRVLVFHIPSRPRGSAYHLDGAYLMRSGEQLMPMSEDRLRAIFAEGKQDWLEEHSRADLSADQVIELLDTQAFFELLKQPYPTARRAVLDRLIQERLVDECADGSFAIRRVGAVLLAKRMDTFPDIARKAPRVVVYSGKSKVETRLDQLGTKGYAVGFQGLVAFVMSQLPQNEIIKDALRTEQKLVSDVAIRELIANALVHQDFEMTGMSVMIEIYADRVEVSNPGAPIMPTSRFIDGYESRNERLADLTRRLGICEEKGSGIDKVLTEVELYLLPAPDFRTTHHRTCAVIFGPRAFDKMTRDDRTRACYQHCALRWVIGEQMTNQSLRKRFQLPAGKSAVVSQIIAATIEAGLIKADEAVGSSRKYARYLPFFA